MKKKARELEVILREMSDATLRKLDIGVQAELKRREDIKDMIKFPYHMSEEDLRISPFEKMINENL